MAPRLKVCAYCATVEGSFEAEHVVPRCLWDQSRPNHMVTVPSCGPCNDFYSKDEAYFRSVLALMTGQGTHPEVDKLLDGKIRRSVARDKQLLRDLTQGLTRVRGAALEQAGESKWAFALDVPRFNRVIEKIVKGLFYFKRERPLAKTHVVTVFPGNGFLSDSGFKNLLSEMQDSAGVGDDVFQFRSVPDSNDPDVTAWIFLFYQTLGVLAWTEGQDTFGDVSPQGPGEV